MFCRRNREDMLSLARKVAVSFLGAERAATLLGANATEEQEEFLMGLRGIICLSYVERRKLEICK
jgi:hypothetical protein